MPTQAARYYDVTLNQPGTITLDMNPQIDALSIAGAAVTARHRRALHLAGVVGHQAVRRRPHDAARRHAGDRYLHADRWPAAVPAGAQRQRQDRGCQRRHPGRHALGVARDARTLWSVDPVHASERRHDQRPVRAIHILSAFCISFALWACLQSYLRRCDADPNSVRRRGRTERRTSRRSATRWKRPTRRRSPGRRRRSTPIC